MATQRRGEISVRFSKIPEGRRSIAFTFCSLGSGEGCMVGFKLRLEDAYWSKGFFNVPVEFPGFSGQTLN